MLNRSSLLRSPLSFVGSTALLAIALFPPLLFGQENSPPAKSNTTRITFLPPPIEGTLSVGIYDRSGKLVRTLHSEATQSDFSTGLNGLITTWDGKDDSGAPVPSGKYKVRGLAVGDLELTGEAFHCNDWVSAEDGPRPVLFHRIAIEGGNVSLIGSDAAGKNWKFKHSLTDGALRIEDAPALPNSSNIGPEPLSCPGRDGTQWAIEKVQGEPIVVQLESNGEVARRLSIGAGEPVPVAIAASLERDEVFLLEKDGDRWRLRGLRRKADSGAQQTGPTWETFLEKNRWPAAQFSDVANRLGRAKPFVGAAKVSVKTQPNPLLGDTTTTIGLTVTTDAEGSSLKTSDGLPLRRLSDTPRLRWAVLGHDLNQPQLVLFQSDGSVVEEYRLRQPGRLMTFDAGEYSWPPK